uniref:Uncharacterized protein n=1 Tax=Yersinia enterocolitica W22703 TaxID=913028 RepID=F4N036_YEREN|nr:unknown protein [Yersinia enterocolitica W22703]
MALAGVSADVKSLEDPALGYPDISTKVQAVIAWYPPINFLKMDEQWKHIGIDGQKHSTADSFESFLMRKQISQVPQDIFAITQPLFINHLIPCGRGSLSACVVPEVLRTT